MLRLGFTLRRYNSTEAAVEVPSNPKIAEIVDQISKLTLLETADLVSSLKVRLARCFACIPAGEAHSSLSCPRGKGDAITALLK